MTDRRPDVHCSKCGAYMHSLDPYRDKMPTGVLCAKCAGRESSVMLDLLDGGFIERYHVRGQRMLTRQCVAEHSWRMAAILFSMWPDARTELVWATLFHDVSERVTGDIPSNVKRASPEIERVIHEVSTNEEIRLGVRFVLDAEEQKMLGWLDRFEGALHCYDELQMGNKLALRTLTRYLEYASDKKFRLEHIARELRRKQLLDDLDQKVRIYLGE